MHTNPYDGTGENPKEYVTPYPNQQHARMSDWDVVNRTQYKGDNFIKYSGEVPQFAQEQLFAWEAAARGNDVNILVGGVRC